MEGGSEMAQQPLRVGFLGVGGIAAGHLRNLAAMEGVTVAAVCDTAIERAVPVGHAYGAPVYTDVTTMLDAQALQALYVCLPPFAHSGQELQAVERGLHLFVEKPVALDLGLAHRTASELQRRGLIGAVGYNWRHLQTVQEIRRRVAPEEVALAMGYWIGGLPGVSWWRRRDGSGGQAVEQTTHIFDLARYLMGEVVSVGAMGVRGHMTDIPDYSVDDASVVTLRFASGAVATITSSCLLASGGRVGLELVGRDLWVELMSGTDAVYRRGGQSEHLSGGGDPYKLEDELFIAAVRAGDAAGIRSTYQDAVRTLGVTLAANQAMESGQVVTLGQDLTTFSEV